MMRRTRTAWLGLVAGLALMGTVQAAVVGQWNGGGRTWDDSSFTQTRAAVVAAGHTIQPASAITPAGLATVGTYIIFEPTTAPTAGELTALAAFVSGGGQLVVFGESSATPAVMTSIVAGSGGSMTWGASLNTTTVVLASPFSSTPNNIVGQPLATSVGWTVAGGTPFLTNGYGSFQTVGAGRIVAFADRLDFNFGSTVNTGLMVNIIGAAAGPGPAPATATQVPTLTDLGIALMIAFLAVAAGLHLRRRDRMV